jgi:hypothetical protein
MHPWPFSDFISIEQLQGSIYNNDFIGVKTGDINNTAQANAMQVLPRDGRRILDVNAIVQEDIVAGRSVEMILHIPEPLSGFQWTMETDGLEFTGIHSEQIQIGDHNVGVLGDGIVTMSWNDEAGQSEGAGCDIHITWKALKAGKASDMIKLTSLVTEAEAYTPEAEILDVRMKIGDHSVPAEFALYQNKPNPWSDVTTIGFDLPADSDIKLTVYDATGKVVKAIEGSYKAGYNTVALATKDFGAGGVMYYRLESGEYSASKKMVLIR